MECHPRRLLVLTVSQGAGIQNVRAHPQLAGGFLCNSQFIARNHLYGYAHFAGARNGGLGLLARRIEKGQHPHKLPLAFLIRPGHTRRKSVKAMAGKFLHRFINGSLHLALVLRHLQDHLRRPSEERTCSHLLLFTAASVRLCTGSKGLK